MSYNKKNRKINSQEIGLDIAMSLAKFVTGKENLHYGYWKNLEVTLENLGKAQEAFTEKLISYLPNKKNLKILDIGGGAGETAKKLNELGHEVTIIVPSKVLAERAKEKTQGKTKIIITTFEKYELETKKSFDLCLFFESFQYIPIETSIKKSKEFIKKDGQILIADCFRSKNYNVKKTRPPGGGHEISKFYKKIKEYNLEILSDEDITLFVSPSIDLEQKFYNTLGFIYKRIEKELKLKKPFFFNIINFLFKISLKYNKRKKLNERLFKSERNSKIFQENNSYIIFCLQNKT